MTTSNLKHHPETLILQPESAVASHNQRITRRALQVGSNCSLESSLQNNYESSSPSKVRKTKGISNMMKGQHQQPNMPISNVKTSKVQSWRKRQVASMISLKPISKQQKSVNTPDRQGYKEELEQTSRKNEGSVSLECEQDNTSNPSLLNINQVKKRSQIDLSSPYVEQRKSYRKAPNTKDNDFISCRRSNDAFQNKIVGIINKMLYGKTCAKEISHATERMGKLNAKELLNKKIISGFRVILTLAYERAQDYDKELLNRMKQAQERVLEDIEHELDNCEEFQVEIEAPEVDRQQLKIFLIRKIYNLSKGQARVSKENLQEGSIKISEAFIKKENFHKNSILRLLQKIQNEGFKETLKNLENINSIEEP